MNIVKYNYKPEQVVHIKSLGVINTLIRLELKELEDSTPDNPSWEALEVEYNHVKEISTQDYENIVSTIIRAKYSQDLVESMTQSFLMDTPGSDELLKEFQRWRNLAKKVAKEIVHHHESVEEAIQHKLEELSEYDKSKEVNEFFINGNSSWFSWAERLKIVNGIESSIRAGLENYTVVFGGSPIKLECKTALDLFARLELYAVNCYNVTEGHRHAISLLKEIDEVKAYDFTLGYPAKLEIELDLN